MNILLIPKFVTSGGIFESINLCENSEMFSDDYFIISLFYSDSKIDNLFNITPFFLKNKYLNFLYLVVFFPLHFLIFNLISVFFKNKVLYTHFFTFMYFNLFSCRLIFIQALEWNFVKNKYLKSLLYFFITLFVSFGTPIFTNKFLFSSFPFNKKAKMYQIWADLPDDISYNDNFNRNYDIVFIIRNGFVKQNEKYFEFLEKYDDLNVAIVTNIFVPVHISNRSNVTLFPILSKLELFNLFCNSKFYVSFSYHEGFSLPCLESMYAGTVPITFDCGGPSSFIPTDIDYLVKNIKIADVYNLIIDLNVPSSWSPLSEKCHNIASNPPINTRLLVDLN